MIKVATVKDAETIASIHVPSKQKAYRGLVADDVLDAKTLEEYTGKWTKWMSDPDNPVTVALSYEEDKPAGFICWGPLRTPPPGTSKIRPAYPAEIYALHIHPDFWRTGHGRKLMQYCAQALKEEKKQNAFCLWALKGNKNADAFYMKLGAQRLGKRLMYIGETEYPELCYGWRDISILL